MQIRSSFVFVHGTGVRGERYRRTFNQLKERLGDDLSGCFWGGSQGAWLRANGASIPHYDATGGSEPSEQEQELALWAVLYTDPWYELRLLRFAHDEASDVPPGVTPPAEALREQIATYVPSAALRAELSSWGLAKGFDKGLAALRASDELIEAAETATVEPLEHRRAIGRALLAYALVDGEVTITGTDRDSLTGQITEELGGYGRSIGDWLTRSVKGIATRAIANRITRNRGSVTDSSSEAGGDILLYQARGDGIRAAVKQAILDTHSENVALIAHSLGGIACVDLLVLESMPQVKQLITVGSQAPFFYEIGALVSLEYPNPLPDHFPDWLNVYDSRDLLSYLASTMFPGRVTDVPVDNGQPFPQSHSAYWTNDEVWTAVSQFVT